MAPPARVLVPVGNCRDSAANQFLVAVSDTGRRAGYGRAGGRRAVTGPSADIWEVMSTARTIRRFTDEPVDDVTLAVPRGGPVGSLGRQRARLAFRRAEIARAAGRGGQGRGPRAGGDRAGLRHETAHRRRQQRRARTYRATYGLHDRAGEFTSVLFAQAHYPTASELLLGGSIFPAMQNFSAGRPGPGNGACLTSWASYEGEQLLREAVGIPEGWMVAGHIVVGWPKGNHGPLRRRPLPNS